LERTGPSHQAEIDLDEVPAVAPLERRTLAADTDWWSGSADLLTFEPVELLATKFRALAQRSKGRDINDLDVAHRQLELPNEPLGRAAGLPGCRAAAHYLFYAEVHPGEFRARLAAHLSDPTFVADVDAYLDDPTTAADPRTLVTRWIRWTDLHLDLPYAQLAAERAPSNRRERAIQEIKTRLADGIEHCPVHVETDGGWSRCAQRLNSASCPEHGQLE
jgi:hypothetical protein